MHLTYVNDTVGTKGLSLFLYCMSLADVAVHNELSVAVLMCQEFHN